MACSTSILFMLSARPGDLGDCRHVSFPAFLVSMLFTVVVEGLFVASMFNVEADALFGKRYLWIDGEKGAGFVSSGKVNDLGSVGCPPFFDSAKERRDGLLPK